MRIPTLIVGLALGASLAPVSAAVAQTTVLDGVYTKAQATRGARTYSNICSHCHEGGEPDALPLIGADFVERWREAPLSFLHGFFSKNMPGDEPGTLKPEVYIDTLAFLLQENGFPAGKELKEDSLHDILMVAEGGPQPLPANAMVRVVGCLAGAGDSLVLEQASLPERVRRADETNAEELAQAKDIALGEGSYALKGNGAEGNTLAAGTKAQVKGVWTQTGSDISVSVLSLGDTGQTCH
jgi:hypothetical protein